MTTPRGKIGYMPKEILIEMEGIKFNFKIDKDSEALKEMARYSNLGREIWEKLEYSKRKNKK
jgi:hypothetical protein